ncbi:hypothetical protein RF644_14885 [Kocuria sp. CPCC 205258]|uniref:hypothetical protein n=1 Tax=Kocuria sp. CPCC 205258 TaxID=3073552 RepID=UPI0034D491AF
MVDLVPPRPILTPADAGSQLQEEGLDALGLSVPALATGWASSTPSADDVDGAALTLTLAEIRAPFQGILHHEATPTLWADPTGRPVGGPAAALRLHPEAATKLVQFVTDLLGAPLVRPVPTAMVVHDVPAPTTPQALNSYRAGEVLDLPAGTHAVSFHDERGLPVHPLAVASLLLALQQRLPALAYGDPTQPALGSAGSVDAIAGLGGATVYHVVDPHGRGYTPTRDAARLRLLGPDGATDLSDGGLGTWPSDTAIGRSTDDRTGDDTTPRLFWGFSTSSTLGRTDVSPPALPNGVTLAHQFFRLTAVDLDWHLLGNRTTAPVQGVGGDDDAVPDFALPVVRPFVPGAALLTDAQDVLGATGQLLAGFPPSGPDVQLLLCSPAIEASLAVPPASGPAGHWPAFPPGPATTLPAVLAATAGLTGTWASGTGAPADVVVTLAADVVPAGTHVRVYPRVFQTIRSIGARPSFVRGDGGSVLAAAGSSPSVLLSNPFGLLPAEPRPDPAVLMVDVVLTGRDGRRRIASMVPVPLGPDQPFTGAGFGGTAVLQEAGTAALLSAFGSTSVAPSALFGIPEPPVGTGTTPGSIIDLVRALAGETTRPRRGPALPTQARHETVLARGVQPAGDTRYGWGAVLSGARWQEESRCSAPELGDPGNPAGPDVFATGVSVGGQLAQDLALHAMKRAQPAIPLGGDTAGWILATAGDNWGPAPLDPPASTVSGVMLETVAPFCDSPELSLLPLLQPGDTVQSVIDDLAEALDVPSPGVMTANEAQIRTRLQREMVTARRGQRDALWSLRRALGQAREFVYVESAQFTRTARPVGPPAAHEVDLVEVLEDALGADPRLKVMIAVPRVPDFDRSAPRYEPFVRAALAHRTEAIESLTATFRDRVAAFHPVGFPGRDTRIRSSTVIVDDVFALVGSSHLRRRGMTFDGACDVALIDRQLDERGYSAAVRRFRQRVMANRLGIEEPGTPATTTALWTRLATGDGAFGVLEDLLSASGLGRCQPVWAGPTDTDVLPKPDAVTDPDGVDEDGTGLLALFLDELIT